MRFAFKIDPLSLSLNLAFYERWYHLVTFIHRQNSLMERDISKKTLVGDLGVKIIMFLFIGDKQRNFFTRI